ncbi:hypothetical protein GOB94_07530 [Granulicella sp. 5B5]|uniref:glycosyltransferase family 39 protein n=1 Tax=Granulicella sp. 5B5 TaxID=1617967 RepID=UPI0015F3B912|nr:glycosyltransferase family 39 protein [Granulicella sp. 5B5]QMV18551.1 hypothetical protein GOB94_07530 [Granulicella sp. 5B5]
MTKRSWWSEPWTIFWVGFALRVAVILIGHTYRVRTDQANFNFGFEAGRIGRSLATGHGFGNPFNGMSGPTAWLPPLYPLLMGAAFKLFGVYSRGAALALMVADSLLSAAIAPAVYEIAERCFDARGIARRRAKMAAPVAVWSAWLWAVYPAALQYAVHWIWEMSLTACLFSWAIVVALRLRGLGGGDERATEKIELWVWLGVLWGLIALSNASLLLCLPAMMIWIAWPELRSRRLEKQAAVGAMLTCVAFAAVLATWVLRNERVMHAPVLTRDNFGVELYESTLERNDGFPWGTTVPLWTGDPEYKEYVREGEVAFAKQRGAIAEARIKARPLRTVKWTLDRFLFFWDGTPHSMGRHPSQEYLRQLSYCFLSVCGLLGLALMLWRRVEGAGLFAAIFVLLPLPYYLVTVQPRFRHPMEPLIAVLAVYLFRSTEKKVEG